MQALPRLQGVGPDLLFHLLDERARVTTRIQPLGDGPHGVSGLHDVQTARRGRRPRQDGAGGGEGMPPGSAPWQGEGDEDGAARDAESDASPSGSRPPATSDHGTVTVAHRGLAGAGRPIRTPAKAGRRRPGGHGRGQRPPLGRERSAVDLGGERQPGGAHGPHLHSNEHVFVIEVITPRTPVRVKGRTTRYSGRPAGPLRAGPVGCRARGEVHGGSLAGGCDSDRVRPGRGRRGTPPGGGRREQVFASGARGG